jgi:hypothetical protein
MIRPLVPLPAPLGGWCWHVVMVLLYIENITN